MEKISVLVVDDEPGLRMGVERVLRDFTFHLADIESDVSFTVDQAESGEEALTKIGQQAPGILLLDHKLPGMSGMEVLEHMPKGVDTLVIVITAYASIETAVRAIKQGAYDFLPKPFTPQELRYSIQKAGSRLVLARKAKALADERKRIRFEFIRVLGHELKAPIGAVQNFLALITKRTMGSDISRYDEVVSRSQVRLEGMRKLIDDLLDVTKIESGQRTRELVELDLGDLARQSLDLIREGAAARGIELHLHCDQAVSITADRSEMDMILNNLISNAVKYNRDQGRVDVCIGRDAAGIISLEVKDTGIGMSPHEVAKLFGEFVRIKNDKTKNILGSGLGLSIVKKLALLYKGNVVVKSEAGSGTTFTVTLPAGAQTTGSAAACPACL